MAEAPLFRRESTEPSEPASDRTASGCSPPCGSADQGHAGVQFNLSTMYATGRDVPQDYVTAHMWANLAGARGDEEARELRDRLAEEMCAGKIAAAQRAAREWRPARR